MIKTLTATQTIPVEIDRAWSFFSEPCNLRRITPVDLGLEVPSAPEPMFDGQTIDYVVRPLLGIQTRWRTRIHLDGPHAFADVQVHGPFRRWTHRHTFTAVEGGTRIDDRIEYQLPFGPLGRLVHRWFVRPHLSRIFRYRAAAIAAIFEPAGRLPDAAAAASVAVAGGTGFVGRAIVAELRRRGRRVVVLSSRGEAARGTLPDDVEIRTADVRSGEGIEAALTGVEQLVISLAFPGSPMEQPRRGNTFLQVDAAGTERLVAASRAAGVKRLLYVSGAGAAPDAKRHWFRAKWRAEEAVRGSGITWTILRPTWIYGPLDVSLNRFLGLARFLPFVPMTNAGRQLLSPICVDDVAGIACDALAAEAAVDRAFEVGGQETLSMREVIGRALRAAGMRRSILPGPAPLLKLAAWPLGLLSAPPLSPDAIDFINQPATVDPAALLEALPRRLTPLDEGLAAYLGPEAPGAGSIVFS